MSYQDLSKICFGGIQVLRSWGQRSLANSINDTGRKLLAQEADKAVSMDAEPGETTDTGSLTLAALKKKKTKKSGQQLSKDEPDLTGNEELKALEAHIFRLSKQGQLQSKRCVNNVNPRQNITKYSYIY